MLNAEALAAQVALAAWRQLLYGVPFELVSDHASLRHLLQQKAQSARILRLCEFLAEFDFQEVQYVKGADNAVPDFLSRPWDADVPDVGLHALSHPRPPKTSVLETLGAQRHPLVILLPVCQDNIAVFHDGRSFSLPIAIPTAEETPCGTAPGAHFGSVHGRSARMQRWESWCRTHFNALLLFGVLPHNEGCATVASLAVLAASAPSALLLPELKTAQQHSTTLFCSRWPRGLTVVITVYGGISFGTSKGSLLLAPGRCCASHLCAQVVQGCGFTCCAR
jgi:hypothetical protein